MSPTHGTPLPVPGQAVADPRGSGRVDQAGAGRGDERVHAQDVRRPREPAQGRNGGERPREDLWVSDLLEPVPDRARGQRTNERDLQQDIDDGADQDRDDDRPRQVAAGVLDLAGELVGLLEARVGEDDARQRQCRGQAPDAAGEQAYSRGGEVARGELEQQHDDGQDRDRDLPPRDDVVDPGEDAHSEEVDRGEHRHQPHRHPQPSTGDLVRFCVEQARPVVGGVGDERVALDRRDRDRLHVREEAEPDAGHTAEREVREPGRPAGDRVHRAELGVGEGQDDDYDCGDDPGQPGTPTDQQHCSQRSEQPAGADDRGLGCPGGADQAQFPFQADVSWYDLGGDRLTCHVRTFFRVRIRGYT